MLVRTRPQGIPVGDLSGYLGEVTKYLLCDAGVVAIGNPLILQRYCSCPIAGQYFINPAFMISPPVGNRNGCYFVPFIVLQPFIPSTRLALYAAIHITNYRLPSCRPRSQPRQQCSRVVSWLEVCHNHSLIDNGVFHKPSGLNLHI